MEFKTNKNGCSFAITEITCPGCGEKLTPADLEVFAACPYCDFKFTRDAALDDFILSPVIRRWAGGSHQSFPG